MRRPSRSVVGLVGLLAVLLAACGTDAQPDTVTWRNTQVHLPQDWYLVEEGGSMLSISNADLAGAAATDEPGELLEGDVVAMYFTFEPDTVPDDWRRFVEEQDGTLETDDRLELEGEVPATRLVFSYESNGTPTREMVVLIPSRGFVVLAQPIPRPGGTQAPQTFLEHVDTFVEVIHSLELGSPTFDDADGPG